MEESTVAHIHPTDFWAQFLIAILIQREHDSTCHISMEIRQKTVKDNTSDSQIQ